MPLAQGIQRGAGGAGGARARAIRRRARPGQGKGRRDSTPVSLAVIGCHWLSLAVIGCDSFRAYTPMLLSTLFSLCQNDIYSPAARENHPPPAGALHRHRAVPVHEQLRRGKEVRPARERRVGPRIAAGTQLP
jgi:hypothetical protein